MRVHHARIDIREQVTLCSALNFKCSPTEFYNDVTKVFPHLWDRILFEMLLDIANNSK